MLIGQQEYIIHDFGLLIIDVLHEHGLELELMQQHGVQVQVVQLFQVILEIVVYDDGLMLHGKIVLVHVINLVLI